MAQVWDGVSNAFLARCRVRGTAIAWLCSRYTSSPSMYPRLFALKDISFLFYADTTEHVTLMARYGTAGKRHVEEIRQRKERNDLVEMLRRRWKRVKHRRVCRSVSHVRVFCR